MDLLYVCWGLDQETLSLDTYINSYKTVIINEIFINFIRLMHVIGITFSFIFLFIGWILRFFSKTSVCWITSLVNPMLIPALKMLLINCKKNNKNNKNVINVILTNSYIFEFFKLNIYLFKYYVLYSDLIF